MCIQYIQTQYMGNSTLMGQKDNFIRDRHGRVRQKQPQFLPVHSKAVECTQTKRHDNIHSAITIQCSPPVSHPRAHQCRTAHI